MHSTLRRRATRTVTLVVVAMVMVAPAAAHNSNNLKHNYSRHYRELIEGDFYLKRQTYSRRQTFSRAQTNTLFTRSAVLASDTGTINDPVNPVDWSQLKGVPADLADGTDDVSSGPASDVDCVSCVNRIDIQNTAVNEQKLSFDPATQAELDALGADDATVNETGDPVHWTKLQGVPAGFADGNDQNGTDVTCIGCVDTVDIKGSAVTESRLSFDPATQGELNALSAADDDVNDGDGSVAWTNLEGIPAGIADGSDDGAPTDTFLSSTSAVALDGETVVRDLDLSSGLYFLLVKGYFAENHLDSITGYCKLRVQGAQDLDTYFGPGTAVWTAVMTSAVTLEAPATIEFVCTGSSGPDGTLQDSDWVANVSMHALELGSIVEQS